MTAKENEEETSDVVGTEGEGSGSSRSRRSDRARRQLQRGRLTRLFEKLTGGPERPGQQKVGKSPVVLLLAGSTVGATLLAAIFWVINARNQEDRLLKEAMTSLEQQKYLDAEGLFEKFISLYPKTDSTAAAKIGLHRSRVEKYILTETPDVIKGLDALKTLNSECRELVGFEDQKDNLKRYADRLTFAGARVAEIAQSQEALDVSTESLELLRKYSGEEGIPASREQELKNRQRVASASVAKKVDFVATLETVSRQLEAGDTVGAVVTRNDLIAKYPALEDDKEVTKVLQDILEREKQFAVKAEIGRDGAVPSSEETPFRAVTLALRTQATTDLSSQGRLVFCQGMDCCFGIDADTGEPVWKTPIGSDAPFAPLLVKSTEPAGVLVYSTMNEELQLLSQADGKVLWKQSTGSRPTAAPVLIADNFYVTTVGGELWQIASANGRAVSKLGFSQKIIGPPAVSSDGQRLIVPGDQTFVYTIGINPFACLSVSYIPHAAGSIRAPLVAAGRYILMVDNVSAEKARIQTLEVSNTGQLTSLAEDLVDGQVNDACLLRGYELFVPSTPQRVTAFRVTDEAGQPPLAKVGSNQLEEGLQTKMHLLAGPGGQLWLGGRDLRKFQTRSNSVVLESGVTAEGVHLQPVQFADESVFLTTRNANSSSVFFTRADREQMKGIWRTVVGSRVVSLSPSATGDSILALADYGESYRISNSELQKGGFLLESVSRFRLPEKLSTPIEGVVLKDGRPAAWCGGPEPSMWTFTTTGQLERKWSLPDSPEVPPVILDEGVVFAMPGRLHISATSGARAAEDYRLTQTGTGQQRWKSLTAISGNQLIAITGDNEFVRVEYRESPRPQLAEVSVTKMPHIVEVPPVSGKGLLFVATAEGKLLMMQASSLEVLAEADLGGPPSAALSISGDYVFAEVAYREVRVFRADSGMPQTGSFPLNGGTLSAVPISVEDGFLVARSDGLLVRLDENGSATNQTRHLGQALQSGAIQTNGGVVIIGFDGSLYLVDPGAIK